MGSAIVTAVAAPGPFLRYTEERGMIEAEEAIGFVIKGFGDCLLFTAKRLHEGAVMVYAYEGRAGLGLSGPKLFRNLAIDEARAELLRVGREEFDRLVQETIASREASRG